MANNWQPKVGEWVVLHSQVLLVQKRDDETTILQDWDKSYQEVFSNISLSALRDGLFRPAVLDDFAVTIPDYGKIWFVDRFSPPSYHEIMVGQIGRPLDYGYYLDSPIRPWILTALIAHYNITVMDEATFKRLSEVKDGD